MTDYDLVVLGAGVTGLGAARTAREAGRRVALPAGVLAEGLRQVRSGQRLHSVIATDDHAASGAFPGRVLSAWLI